jgi:imidazolonepropionase
VGAAHALKLQNLVGSLEVDKSADLISTDQDWQCLFYSVGDHPEKLVFSRGKRISKRVK